MPGPSHEVGELDAASLEPDEMERLFRAPIIATVSTVSPAGYPQSSPVWIKYDDGRLLFSAASNRVKIRYLRANPRVSVMAFDPENPRSYVHVQGTVTITPDGAMELIDELSLAYCGKPWASQRGEERVVVRVEPSKIFVRR